MGPNLSSHEPALLWWAEFPHWSPQEQCILGPSALPPGNSMLWGSAECAKRVEPREFSDLAFKTKHAPCSRCNAMSTSPSHQDCEDLNWNLNKREVITRVSNRRFFSGQLSFWHDKANSQKRCSKGVSEELSFGNISWKQKCFDFRVKSAWLKTIN